MNCVFVQIRCKPGKIFQVAEEITLKEIQSELYSTSGTFDLLLKLYIPTDEDVGEFINDNLLNIKWKKRKGKKKRLSLIHI